MRERTLLFIVVLVFLAACQQQAVVPTLAPTIAAPTATPEEMVTEPPPPTARPRATLPPTWTPASEVTNTPLPTAVPAGNDAGSQNVAPVVVPTLPEACNAFEPDLNRNTRTYRSGEDPTVYWIPVEGAEYYSVSLTDENGDVIFTDYTADFGVYVLDRSHRGWQPVWLGGVSYQCPGRSDVPDTRRRAFP